MLKIERLKNKYMIEVTRGKGKGKDENGKRLPVRYYQPYFAEAMLDAYWAFIFSNATSVKVRSTRDRHHTIYHEFKSVKQWEKAWKFEFGENANYFVWRDRH